MACGLCNHFVEFLLPRNKHKKLFFSPLQGKFINKTPAAAYSNQETIVFLKDEIVFIKSRAAIEILASLGGFWICVKAFLLIPPFIRDFVYDYIAKHRYGWFGKNEHCRIPTNHEKKQFLD
jgi:predicted DCC family thiol-disulfide oxidoreductase YuxK